MSPVCNVSQTTRHWLAMAPPTLPGLAQTLAMSCFQVLASHWPSTSHHKHLIGSHPPMRPTPIQTFYSASNSKDNLGGMVAGSTLTTLACRFNIITRYVGAAQRSPHQTPGWAQISRRGHNVISHKYHGRSYPSSGYRGPAQ